MRLGLAIGTVLGTLLLVGCAGNRTYLRSDADPVLTYGRTMCFGPCPAFSLEVDRDGLVRFNGRAHVDPIGPHTGRWTEADLQRLAQRALEVDLAGKAGTYDNPMIMDLPSTQLTFGPHKVVDRVDGPDLEALYAALDSLISITEWKPVPAEH